MTILWPADVLWPGGISVDLLPRSLAAPSSVSGFGQVVASDAGIWKVTFADIPIYEPQKIKCFRAVASLLEGRLNPILVPLLGYERSFQPVPGDGADLFGQLSHSDDAFFDDDTGYVGRVIDVVTVGSMALRAVSGTVTVNYAGEIEPGQHFSVGERLYRVRSFDPDTGAITFRPPLRAAVPSGTNLEFDNPVCRMRLASDSEMNIAFNHVVMGKPTVNFIEDL